MGESIIKPYIKFTTTTVMADPLLLTAVFLTFFFFFFLFFPLKTRPSLAHFGYYFLFSCAMSDIMEGSSEVLWFADFSYFFYFCDTNGNKKYQNEAVKQLKNIQ